MAQKTTAHDRILARMKTNHTEETEEEKNLQSSPSSSISEEDKVVQRILNYGKAREEGYANDKATSSLSRGETQRGDGSQTTDLRPGETRRGNKPEASLLEKIQYVQARGADAFAAANENLNILGEAIAAGINSGIESAKNRDTLDVVLSSAAKGAANSLDKSAEENVNERARQAIDSKYAHVVNSKGASVAADLVSSVNQMIPAVMLPGAAGTAFLAATNFPESYVSARNNGADQKQAATYGAVNAAINSVGEQLIGGIASKGTGLAGKAANAISGGASSRLAANAMNSIAKSPLAKTALSAVAKSAGEGAEEIVQSLLSTAAERATYNPEAKVDAKELAYEGLLGGLMGGAFQAASLPATYQAYRSDYDTVNNFSLAGEAVANESDVEIIRNVGESIVKGADEILSDKSADADRKQRAQYIKSGVEAVMKKLDESSADIIMGNQQKYDALEKLISSDRSNVVENLAVLVRDVSGATSGNKDAINKTVDFVRGEIQNANNILATSSDPNVRQEAAVNLQNYKDVDRTLRTFRKQINKALADLPAQSNAEMQVPAQTEPKAQVQTENVTETASAPEPTKPRQTITKSVLKGYGVDTEVPASKFPEYLLNQLQTGKITQEEADALDAEYEAKYPKKAAEIKLNAATAAYQKGEISEEQYDAQYSQYETELKDIDSRMSSESFPVRLRPVYEEVVQPVSEAEAQTEQTVDDSTNAADTTSVNAGEGSASVRENAADIAGDEAQTAEEVAERLAEEGYSFRDIRDQINAYRAENTAESNAAAARLEEADRILVKKNRANVQKVANAYAPILKRFGINDVVVEDMPVGRNAAFDRKTNTIHLSSRISDSGAVGRFIVHEFTHRGTKIDMSLADSIVSAMESRKGGRGYISEAVIRDAYADQLSGLSAEEADSIVREERAAHFMERIMEDVNVLDEFRDDRTFLRKVLDAIRDFFARNNPDKQEQIRLRRIEDKINDLLKAANVDAEVETGGGQQTDSDLTPGRDGVVYSDSGEAVADSTTDGTIRLSLSTYEAEGRDVLRKYLDKSVSSGRLTAEEAREMQDSLEDIYRVCSEFKDKYAPFSAWSDAEVVRDTHGRPVFSVVTPNGEYKMNLDFSLVCKKRRTLDAVFNEMAQRGIIDEFELGQKSVVKINEIVRKHGFETACALCFVDAKRFRQASMADQFVSLYNELVESLVPEDQKGSIGYFNFSGNTSRGAVENGIDTWGNGELDFSHLDYVMKNYSKGTVEYKSAQYIKGHPEARKLLQRGDFMSSAGFDAVKSQNATIMKLYNSKKGTGGPKAAFGDVQYLSEVIKKAKGWTPAKAYAVGGVRVQSFSDYVPRMVFDYAQMIHDLAATGLPAHAYTKEVLFAKQFGLTGVKINMSLIPAVVDGGIAPGLDADGNYVWAGESFNYDEAVEIQNADGYTENCGTICVGVSKKHILKLLDDPNIRMVIPYHKSGLNPIVAHMNKIDSFVDYTGAQNTLDENGKKLSKDFDFNKVLREVGDPQKAVDRYLAWVDEHGYTAKFNEFRRHPNYYKLLEDFTLYDMDGNYVPQRAVKAVFPQDGDTFGSMRDLIESGLQEDAVIEGRRDAELGEIVDEIEQTLPKTEEEIEETAVEQAEGDVERDIRESRELDEEYMSAVESGDTEKAQKMVDEAAKKAGYTITAYHGTPTGGFTKFDSDRIGSNTGMGRGRFSFTSDKSVADIYSGKGDKTARASELVVSLNKLFSKYDSEELRMLFTDYAGVPVEWDSDSVIADGALENGYIEFDPDWEDNDPDRYANREEAKAAEKLAEFEGTRQYMIDTLKSYQRGSGFSLDDLFGKASKNTDSSLDEFFDEAFSMLESMSPERTPMTYSVYLKTPTAEFEADTKNYNSVAWDAAYSDADVAVIHLDNGEDRYFVNNPASIKSSDAIVYDDNGDVIPLSERFNPSTPDIRYSRDLDPALEREIRLRELDEQIGKQLLSLASPGWKKEMSSAQRDKFAKILSAELPGVSAREVSDAIKPVFELFAKPNRGSKDTAEVRVDEIKKLAQKAAETLVNSAVKTELDPRYAEFKELVTAIRSTKGDSVTDSYKSLSEKFPEYFEPYTSELSEDVMSSRIKAVRSEASGLMRAKWTSDPFEGIRDDAVRSFTNRILTGFVDASRYTEKSAQDIKIGALSSEIRSTQKQLKDSEREVARQERQIGKQEAQIAKRDAVIAEDKIIKQQMKDTLDLFASDMKHLNREVKNLNRRIIRLENTISSRSLNTSLASEQKRAAAMARKIYNQVTRPSRKNHVPESIKEYIVNALRQFDGMKISPNRTIDATALDSVLTQIKANEYQTLKLFEDDNSEKKQKNNITLNNEVLERMNAQMDAVKLLESAVQKARQAGASTEEIKRLSVEYYQATNEFLKMLNGYINQTNRAFVDGKNVEVAEFTDGLLNDLNLKKGAKDFGGQNGLSATSAQGVRNFANALKFEAVSPAQFFRMIGEHGMMLARTFRAGQDAQNRHLDKYVNVMQDATNGEYKTRVAAGTGGNRIDVTIDGKKVDVSKSQLMSLYCLWQRPAARHHLEAQGAVFLNTSGGEMETRTFPITEEVFNDLMKNLSAQDIRLAQVIQKFLSKECSAWGNEASMKLYGYTMFHEDFYFPIRVSQSTKLKKGGREWGSSAGEMNLEFSSFTNSVQPNSTSAIVIDNIFDVAEGHVQKMAAYNAYAPICHDLQRILANGEVRDAIVNNMGQEALKYMFDFLKKVNGNVANERGHSHTYGGLQTLGNLSKRASVSANFSSAFKQFDSIFRACDEIHPKYLIAARTGFGSQDGKGTYGRTYRRMVENSGIAKMKMLGYSDAGFGKSLREQWDKDFAKTPTGLRRFMDASVPTHAVLKGYDKLTDLGMWMSGKADETVWVGLYRACELEATDKYKGASAAEITQKATKRFNEIIGETQVVDSVMDSTPFSENVLGTGFGAFMNEPVRQFGHLMVAADAMRDGKPGAGKKLAKVFSTVIFSSMVVEPLKTALASLLRDNEDDDEQFFRKIFKLWTGVDFTDGAQEIATPTGVMSSNLVDGLLGIVPAFGQIYDIVMETVQGYSSTRLETEGIEKLTQYVKALIGYDSKEGIPTKTKAKLTIDILGAVGKITGMPISTLIRDLQIPYKSFMSWTDDYVAQWEYNKMFYNLGNGTARSSYGFYDIFSKAVADGDTDSVEYMRNDLEGTKTGKNKFGVTYTDIRDALKDRGGKYIINDDVFLKEIQAEFSLPIVASDMTAEKLIRQVYAKAIDQKDISPNDALKALPSTPEHYSYEKKDENGNTVYEGDGEDRKAVVVEMTETEYAKFIEDVGVLRRNIVSKMAASGDFKKLSNDTEAQIYCLEKAYDFAARYYRSKFNPNYDLSAGGKWMAKFADGKLDYSKIVHEILTAENGRKK